MTYVNGKLAICAQDTTLKELLRAVSFATGAVVEFPHDRAGEHISANIGPGPVRDVLATLFNGSGLNYVMFGPQNNPSALQRLILTSAGTSTQGAPDLPPAQTAQVGDARENGQPIASASNVGIYPSAGCFRFAGSGSQSGSTEGTDRSGSPRANDARLGAED